MSKLERIVIHWTAGAHRMSSVDRKSYHFCIEGNGTVQEGDFPPEANIAPVPGRYAPHTLNLNTGSIGVALCAMHGAVERPFRAGPFPITGAQVDTLATLVAKLAAKYGIPITPQTILTHAEVQPTLGVAQRGKWDITWLPGMSAAADPITVGNQLRQRIGEAADAAPPPPPPPDPTPPAALARLAALEKWARGIGYAG